MAWWLAVAIRPAAGRPGPARLHEVHPRAKERTCCPKMPRAASSANATWGERLLMMAHTADQMGRGVGQERECAVGWAGAAGALLCRLQPATKATQVCHPFASEPCPYPPAPPSPGLTWRGVCVSIGLDLDGRVGAPAQRVAAVEEGRLVHVHAQALPLVVGARQLHRRLLQLRKRGCAGEWGGAGGGPG